MKRVLVLGGSGFVGRSFCERWSAQPAHADSRLIVPTRRRAQARHLLHLPTVDVVEADVHDAGALAGLLRDVDAVVNLVAILHGRPAEFEQVHVGLPQRLASACRQAGVHRVVHVSALGVSEAADAAPSHYLRSKGRGEQVWRESGLEVTLLRPSVIFGAHDQFLHLFAKLQSVFPLMPLAGSEARFQPVWVEDVAEALCRVLLRPHAGVYELAGPTVYTLGELVKLAGRWSGHERPVLPLPMALGRLQAGLLACLPGKPLMSLDNLDSMAVPNVATGQWPGLADLGITPTALEAVGPRDLGSQAGWAGLRNAWRAQR